MTKKVEQRDIDGKGKRIDEYARRYDLVRKAVVRKFEREYGDGWRATHSVITDRRAEAEMYGDQGEPDDPLPEVILLGEPIVTLVIVHGKWSKKLNRPVVTLIDIADTHIAVFLRDAAKRAVKSLRENDRERLDENRRRWDK